MFEEFHLHLFNDLKGQWMAEILRPVGGAGATWPVNVVVTRQQLAWLRNGTQPDAAQLQDIGDKVWKSLLPNPLPQKFQNDLANLGGLPAGVRITVALTGVDAASAPANLCRVCDLPLETLYEAAHAHFGSNGRTPITRCLQVGFDVDPEKVAYPLRILLAVSAPSDLPSPGAPGQEEAAIRQALGSLIDLGGPIELTLLHQPTRISLMRELRKNRYHVLHFVGHGGFGIVDRDPNPQGHLLLIQEGTENSPNPVSDPTPASVLLNILRNSGVRLAVLTACSSAQASQDGPKYPPAAFTGVAQRLISATGGVSAVVAMQFDLANAAAVAFSKSFYGQLVEYPERPVDVIVAEARNELSVGAAWANTRTWVTPAVFSRCRGGRVFDFQPYFGTLSEAACKELAVVEEFIDILSKAIAWIDGQSAGSRLDLVAERARNEALLQAKLDRRGELLGETVGVRGGKASRGSRISGPLVLRTRLAGAVNNLVVKLQFEATKLTLLSAQPGKDLQGGQLVPSRAPGRGQERLVALNLRGGQSLPAGEYELAVLEWEVTGAAPGEMLTVIADPEPLVRNGQPQIVRGLNGLVFVTGANAIAAAPRPAAAVGNSATPTASPSTPPA